MDPSPTPRTRAQLVWGASITGLCGLFLALRLPYLAGVPNASHDEGNWLLVAWQVATGRAPELSSDARFVTTLFARMVALAWRLCPISLGSARAALVLWQLGFTLAIAWLAARMRLPRAGIAMAALLAVHPWSVLWSRSITVPYALSLALSVLSPMAFLYAWMGAPRHPRLARVAAGQLFALGFHFTPLAAIAPLGALSWALATPSRRARLRAPFSLVSGLLAIAHVVPIALSAAHVAARGSTRPSHHFTWFAIRLRIYTTTIFEGLTGEATLRDYCGNELPRGLSWCVTAFALALAIAALWPAAQDERDGSLRRSLATLGLWQFVAAYFGLALMLAPMRQWHLQVIDAERYLFVTLAPFTMLVGALAELPEPRALAAPIAVIYLLLGPTRRASEHLLHGGGPDRGLLTQYGGGAERRWKVSRELTPLPELIFDEARRAAPHAPAVIVTSDYRHHPLWFYRSLHRRFDIEIENAPTGALAPRPGVVHVFVRWSDGLFAPGFRPAEEVRANERVTAIMRGAEFMGLTRARVVVQPDGSPLIEVWTATRRGDH